MAVPDGGRRPRPSPASTARPLRFLFTRFAPWTPSPAARAPRRPAPRRRHAGPSERRLRDGNRPQAIFPASGHYRQTYSMIRIPPRPPCIPPSSFLSRHRTQGVLPLGRRTSPPGSPGAGGNKIFLHISCSYVAFCLPLPPEHYLSRQESYRPPPPLYPLPLPTPHGTRQPPRHSRHASARPRPGTPPPASGHRRASPLAKVCGRGGEGAPAGRHTERRTGRKVIAFRNNWLEQEQQGLACRGE